jgi:cysteine desulfurase
MLLNPTEHSCVLASAQRWFPGRVDLLPVDASGVVDRAALQERLTAGGVAAVAIMAANNETGVLQPWREFAADCRALRCRTFATPCNGSGNFRPAAWAERILCSGPRTNSAGAKGAGFLKLPPGPSGRDFVLHLGGGEQGGRRSGTVDYPAMAALPGIRIVGEGTDRLWNTVMAILPEGENARWLTKLDRRGLQVSTTAACAAGQGCSSAVLAALGVLAEQARRALRFSAGWATTAEDWQKLLRALVEVHREIGRAAGVR